MKGVLWKKMEKYLIRCEWLDRRELDKRDKNVSGEKKGPQRSTKHTKEHRGKLGEGS